VKTFLLNNKHSILSEPYPSHGSASFSTFCWNFFAQSTALFIVVHSASRRLASFSALASAGRSSETTLFALEDGVLRCLVAPSGGGDGLQWRQVLGGRRRWGRRGRRKTEAFARRRSVHECTQTVTRRQRRARHGSTCMPPGRPCQPRRWPRRWRLRPRRRPGCTLLQRQRGVPVRSSRSRQRQLGRCGEGKWRELPRCGGERRSATKNAAVPAHIEFALRSAAEPLSSCLLRLLCRQRQLRIGPARLSHPRRLPVCVTAPPRALAQ